MRILIFIILLYSNLINFSFATEKNDCKEFKRFTKEHISCMAQNLKKIALKGTNKLKKDFNTASEEVKDDTNKIKDKTKQMIEKGKEKIN
tara:strand:+ start:46 stop:315 length:270 start_codon:yes stop_codon:yes gene_type:complete